MCGEQHRETQGDRTVEKNREVSKKVDSKNGNGDAYASNIKPMNHNVVNGLQIKGLLYLAIRRGKNVHRYQRKEQKIAPFKLHCDKDCVSEGMEVLKRACAVL